MNPFDWIFFDCFNTLIDDFDDTGDESGLGPILHLPLEAGFYFVLEDFRQDYDAWRKKQWPDRGWREVSLPDRLRAIFNLRAPDRRSEIEALVTEMIRKFEADYPRTLRLTPGVCEMLDFWYGRCRMSVVSNFFLLHWPTRCLEVFGLRKYFDFVLDSSAFGWKKPSYQIYQEALRLANVPLSRAGTILFIGDNLKDDVLMPRQIGMQAVYFDRSKDRPSSSKAPDGILSITHWDQFRLSHLN